MPTNLCFLCEDGVSDTMCPGCGDAICPDCKVNGHVALGFHDAEDHLASEEEVPDDC